MSPSAAAPGADQAAEGDEATAAAAAAALVASPSSRSAQTVAAFAALLEAVVIDVAIEVRQRECARARVIPGGADLLRR